MIFGPAKPERMRWRTLLLLLFSVAVVGGLVGVLASLYILRHPLVIGDGGTAYNILRDVTTIAIAVLAVLTAVFIAIGSLVLRSILLRELRAEFTDLMEESKDAIEEGKNELFSNLSTKVGFLWGRHFELSKMKEERFINFAIEEGERAVDYANMLDETKHWKVRVRALNNYLMALAEKGDSGDANKAYKLTTDLEQLLKKHENELELHKKQNQEETIYFTRCRLPRRKSNDRKEAKQNFYRLKGHPHFNKWKQRWIDFKLLP